MEVANEKCLTSIMLYELHKLSEQILKNYGQHTAENQFVRFDIPAKIAFRDQQYPLHVFSVGTQDPRAPVLFLTGGFHGLERIGAQLAWSLLKTTVDRLMWDQTLRDLFQRIRLVVMPLVNPVGYLHYLRSNGQGVDLMRNSPVLATDRVPFFLGGQRFSPKLPWYQGAEGVLEKENQVVLEVFQKEVAKSPLVISVDFHSGFGMKDRLWFPYSSSYKPFENLAELHSLTHLLEQTHPYHIYHIEPQSKGYLLNGDMWDYLYQEFNAKNAGSVFIPMTLEMGSWTWVRKNPWQIFSLHGAFNPVKVHRLKRTYRRHHLLYDFLLRALYSNANWLPQSEHMKTQHLQKALGRWYDS